MQNTAALLARTLLQEQTRYKFLEPLGRGSFGLVIKAQDTLLDPPVVVAIKLLKRSTFTAKSRDEIQNHAKLLHGHVIQFKDVFLLKHWLCIVMEYASEGNLLDYVLKSSKAGRLQEPVARWFLQQLILAVDYCHRREVANRDIKLENILLHREPSLNAPLLKLCDFGYSRGQDLSNAHSSVGSAPYMAPEVQAIAAARDGTYNSKLADVWSCGVVLFAMVYGEFPFAQTELMAMLKAKLTGDYTHRADVPISDSCRQLIDEMLEPDPRKRITIAALFQHPWFLVDLPRQAVEWNLQCLREEPSPATVEKMQIALQQLEY